MVQQIELEVSPREVMGKATRALRKAGIVPANISGHKQASQAVQFDSLTFELLRRAHGVRSVFTLRMPASTETVLVREIQQDPLTGRVLHVEFARVALDERITVKIPLEFVGESPAVKNENGVLLHLVDTLEVECTASNLVQSLPVDVAPLAEIDATLYAKDVRLPDGYTLLTDPEELIAKVTASRVAVEVPEAPAATGEAASAGAAPAGE